MRGKFGRISVAVIATVAAVVAVVGTAIPGKLALAQVGQQPPPDGLAALLATLNDGPTAFLVGIDEGVNLDPNTVQLRQAMATVLNGYAVVPDARLTYWSAVNNANDCVIIGWTGAVTDVQPNGNGNLVTVMVAPTVDSATYGQSCVFINSDYSEKYQVNADGTFTYVGSLDPQGLAGQLPGIATL